jgi:signal transduction histidine kinase
VALGALLVLITIALPGSDGRLAFLIGLPVFALIPAAIAFAILRDRLYDLDLAINRSLVYGTLAVLLAIGYAGVLTLAGVATGERPTLGVVAAVTAMAVVALPLRAWLQRLTDRLMFGDRGDPYAAVSRVSATLQGAAASGSSLETVVGAIAGSLKLAYVAIETPGHLRASIGEPAREPVTIAMTHQGTPVGTLIAAGPPGRPIGPRDRALLTELARHAGAAVYAAGLADDLQSSRQRLVEAREEERRRLRRDLHDGLGPGLASVVLGLDLAAGQLRTDPGSAHTVLKEVKAEMVTAVDEIRRLVYELRPPALDDLGLVGALRQQAERIGRRHPLLTIAVAAPETMPALPAATEVAAYRIATGGTSCTVRIGLDGQLSVEVTDNGAGLAPAAAPGVGLAAMRERAQELGGTFGIGAAHGGGTRLLATLPLAAPAPQPMETP